MDCIPQFRAMQECFQKYPEEYGRFNDDEEEEKEGEGEAEGGGEHKSQPDDPKKTESTAGKSDPDSGSKLSQSDSNFGSKSDQSRTE